MNHKKRRLLTECQSSLRKGATSKYLWLLSRLLRAHQEYEFLKPLSDALRRRDFGSLYSAADSLSSQKYEDAATHLVANQFSLLIKKYPWPTDLLDLKPRENARASFLSSEKRCGLINRKFKLIQVDRSIDRFRQESGKAKFWIRTIIGSRPNYRKCFQSADFGPGACVGVHGNATSYAAKFSAARWTVAPGALHHGFAAIRQNYHLWEALLPVGSNGLVCYDEEAAFAAYLSRIHVVANNKISFVAKTAKTNRVIAIEPMLNGLVQKGIDQVMRKHLLKVGIDLSDQGRNQTMARLGSLDDSDNGFVTIDLKSASDSISTELVRHLIPDDWFRLLDRTRSKCFELDGVITDFKKFCSMGNGFCFPLETLIFAAAAYACNAGVPGIDFVVYGDDIIVRKKFATHVIKLLNHWGFKINSNKTFLEGPFRESCGSDWFAGKDVRPFTLDYALDSLQSYFKFLNLSRRNELTENFFSIARGHVVKTIPEQFRFFRPLRGEEDSGIDSTGDEHLSVPSCLFNPKRGRWEWMELTSRPRVDFDTLNATGNKPWLISVALRGGSSVNFGLHKYLPEVTLRNETQTRVVRKGYVSTSNWLPPPHPLS